MQDIVVPPYASDMFTTRADTSDGIVPLLNDILELEPEYIAEGVRGRSIPVTPVDLSAEDRDTLLATYQSYCDFFTKYLGHHFRRTYFEGYNVTDVLYFLQFLSAINHATPDQIESVDAAAADYFGPTSRAYLEGYVVIAYKMIVFDVGKPSALREMSLTDLLDYYAELNNLDRLNSHMDQVAGWGEWITDLGGNLFNGAVKWLGKGLKALGWIVGISDFIGDRNLEAARVEINWRVDESPDDDITYEYIKTYIRNNFGEDLPV